MEVEFSLTEADYVAYWGYLWDHPSKGNRTNRTRLAVLCAVWVLCVGVPLLVYSFHRPEPLDLVVAAVVAVPAVLMTAEFVYRRQSYAYWSLRYMRKHPEHGWFERRKLTISSSGIGSSTRHTSGHMSWVRVQEVGRTQGLVVFRYGTRAAFLLPKRAFPQETDFVHFVETATRWWQEARESADPDG